MTAPTPSRRWRFSLRTLFVVVTALCIWIGWNAHQVHERNKLIAFLEGNRQELAGSSYVLSIIRRESAVVPTLWRWLGAREWQHNSGRWPMLASHEFDLDVAKSLLPECELRTFSPRH